MNNENNNENQNVMNNNVNNANVSNQNMVGNNVNNQNVVNATMTNQAMASQNMNIPNSNPEVKSKMNPGIKILLIVIVLLIIGIGCFAGYTFLKKKNPETIYYTLIDKFGGYVSNTLDNATSSFKKPTSLSGTITFNASSNNSQFKKLANIINKLKININEELDVNNKYANMTYDINYGTDKLIKASLIIDEKDGYVNLDELYSKNIKLSEINFDPLWNLYNMEDYKVFIEEYIKIFKASLKKEYFTSEKTTIEINGNKLNVTDYKLNLNSENLNELRKNLNKEALNNDKFTNALANISGISKEEVKEMFTNNEDTNNEYEDVTIEIFASNNQTVEKISIKGASEFVLERIASDTYDILSDGSSVGSLKVNDNYISYEANDSGVEQKITLDFRNKNQTSLDVVVTDDETSLSLNLSMAENDMSGNISFNDNTTKTKLDMQMSLKGKEIDKVAKTNVSNYVNFEDLSENDISKIQEKIQNNNALLAIIEDIAGIGLLG